MNINIDFLKLLQSYPVIALVAIAIAAIQILKNHLKDWINLLPSKEKDLKRLEALKLDLNYPEGEALKDFVDTSIKKLHFKLATGLFSNNKSRMLFDLYQKNTEIGLWKEFKQENKYLKVVNDKLTVHYGFGQKLETFLHYFYFSFILIAMTFLAFIVINYYTGIKATLIAILFIFILLVSLYMIIKKRLEIKFLRKLEILLKK